jgi:tetratricopeptide (TPR) repeat protein
MGKKIFWLSILGTTLIASLIFFLFLINSHREDRYIRQGDELVRRGEIELAVQQYLKALEINPKKADGYVRLGKIYDLQNKPNEALSYLSKAIELEPNKSEYHYYLAISQEEWAENDSDFKKAIMEYRKAIELNPEFVEARFRLGNLYRQLDEENLTIAEFMEAVNRSTCIVTGKILVENQPLASAELNLTLQPESEPIFWSGVRWTTFTDSFGNYLLPLSSGQYHIGGISYIYGEWDAKKDYTIVSNFPATINIRKKIAILPEIKLVSKIEIIYPPVGKVLPEDKIVFQWHPYSDANNYSLEIGEFTHDQLGNWEEKKVLWRRQNIIQPPITYNDDGQAVTPLSPGKNYYAILTAYDIKGRKLSSVGDDQMLSWHFTVKK